MTEHRKGRFINGVEYRRGRPINECHGWGCLIQEARLERGLSQEGVADFLGCTRSHVSNMERGLVQHPPAWMRRKLEALLGVTNVELLVAANEVTEEELKQWANTHP